MNKIGSIIIAAVFLAEAALGGILTAASPEKTFSENENRELAAFPEVSVIRDGSSEYFDKLEEYLGDHFAGRDKLVSAYTEFLLASGKKNVRDLLVLSDSSAALEQTERSADAASDQKPGPDLSDYLFGAVYTVVRNRCGWLMEEAAAAREKYGTDLYYTVIPEKVLTLSEGTDGAIDSTLCRENLEFIHAAAEDHNVDLIDVCPMLLNRYDINERAEMFFKTDFHWNPLGGYRTAELLALELVNRGVIGTSSVPVASDFYWRDLTGREYSGDLAKRLSYGPSDDEFIPLYKPVCFEKLSYFDSLEGEAIQRSSIVCAGEDSQDPLDYNLLTTPNLGYYRVENPGGLENKRVLILKDSMENAMTEYFSVMFSEINVVDPRAACPAMSEIIEKRNIDLVLCIYHENNISDELRDYLSAAE